MSIGEIILISIGLAMDAFAVAISKGLVMKKNYKSALIIGLYFGIFQALMPLLGYLLGFSFSEIVAKVNHYIAFALLTIIGTSMLLEKDSDIYADDRINFSTMILLSIATSIDALTIGVTFAFLEVNIVMSILIIGIITFILSSIGVLLGNKIGIKFKSKSQLVGGVVLILTGIKILLEHLNII